MSRTDFSFTVNNALLRGVALRGAAFGVLAAAITQPALAADASNGERLGMRWCAACHLVASGQAEANSDAPPFVSIARKKQASELKDFLTDPHPKMPNMSLSRSEIADIVAYIKTLDR